MYSLCRKIPRGKVTTYGEIGETLGMKGYQAIGQILKKNPDPEGTPCYKIVKSDGSLGGYCGKMNNKEKTIKLKKDGISVVEGKIDLSKHLHKFFKGK